MVWNAREARHRREPGNHIVSGSYDQTIKGRADLMANNGDRQLRQYGAGSHGGSEDARLPSVRRGLDKWMRCWSGSCRMSDFETLIEIKDVVKDTGQRRAAARRSLS